MNSPTLATVSVARLRCSSGSIDELPFPVKRSIRPAWTPPAEVRKDKPFLPAVIPGGAPNNPMGVAAMTLAGGEYAIHGTNQPGSIGGMVSYGCIRMLNADITDLFGRVGWGTTVVVTQ